MAKQKKRNKKYNKFKTAHTVALSGLRDLIITYNDEDKACKVRCVKTGKEQIVTRNMFNAVWQFRYKWGVWLAALIQESNGKEAYVWSEVEAPFECFHDEINDSLSAEHKDFIDGEKAKGNKIINVGWLACHTGLDLSDDQVEFMLEASGV